MGDDTRGPSLPHPRRVEQFIGGVAEAYRDLFRGVRSFLTWVVYVAVAMVVMIALAAVIGWPLVVTLKYAIRWWTPTNPLNPFWYSSVLLAGMIATLVWWVVGLYPLYRGVAATGLVAEYRLSELLNSETEDDR